MKIGFFLDILDQKNAVTKLTLKLAEKTVSAGHSADICYVAKAESAPLSRDLSTSGARLKWIPSLRGAMKLYTAPYGAELRRLLGAYDLSVAQSLMRRQDVVVMNNDPQVAQVEALARAPFTVVKPTLWTRRRELRASIEACRFKPGNFKQVVAPSAGTARRIAELLKIAPDRISVIPLGVDLEQFYPELRRRTGAAARKELGIGENEKVFLYVGDYWKGLEFAILGLARITSRRKIKLLALGSFNPEPFKALCAKTGVSFTHYKCSDNIRLFYSAADVFLLPTPLDTFGLASLEAMAMGLPVILSPRAGLSELLTHQKDALILDHPFDPACIAEQAIAALDIDLARNMGKNASSRAENLTWESTAMAHLELYQALMGQEPASN